MPFTSETLVHQGVAEAELWSRLLCSAWLPALLSATSGFTQIAVGSQKAMDVPCHVRPSGEDWGKY